MAKIAMHECFFGFCIEEAKPSPSFASFHFGIGLQNLTVVQMQSLDFLIRAGGLQHGFWPSTAENERECTY